MHGTLSDITLFADVPRDSLELIEGQCAWMTLGEGDQVFDKDSDTLDVYFVAKGNVRILSMVAPDQEVALADIRAGGYFGELAAIDGQKRSARAVATTETVLASLSGPAFLDVLRAHHSVTVQVLSRIGRVVRDLDRRVVKMSSQTEHQRIWSELLRLAEPQPSRTGQWYIPDMPNHREIAAWAGTSKESVAAAIGELARDGIVKRQTMGLIISDMPRLQAITKNL
jgi:CRP-like cAMP-binding protein